MKKKIVFMGTPEYATIILDMLVKSEEYEVIAVYSQPDKPIGRKQTITPPHVKNYLLNENIEVETLQPERFRDSNESKRLHELKPDFIVVAAYGQILPKDVVENFECINLHASILPKYRGASPIQEMVLNLDEKIGVTCMKMAEGLDTGDILGVRYLSSSRDEYAEDLFSSLAFHAGELLIKCLDMYKNVAPIVQNGSDAILCKKIRKIDGEVKFDNASKVFSKFRAYKNWPGIFTESGLKLKKIDLEDSDGEFSPLEILSIGSDYVIIGCTIGSLRIYAVQPPSKTEMDIHSYLRGKRLSIGDTLS